MLQIVDAFKQIARLRVAAGAKHAHRTFRPTIGHVVQSEWRVLLSRRATVKDKAGFLLKAVKPRDKR